MCSPLSSFVPILPRRHFLGWDRPLLPQAAAWLASEWTGAGPLDLSRTVAVVPTRESGRRLREALAAWAASRGSAVFPPRVFTPEALLNQASPRGMASRLESTLGWVEALREIDLDGFRAVFPVDPPDRSFTWALRLADQLTRLQGTLAENALSIADVLRRVGQDFPEAERWEQLAALERRHRDRLAQAGWAPPSPGEPADAAWAEEVDRVVIVATPDPVPALLVQAGSLRGVTLDVLVFAPAEHAADFDDWGRPLVSRWTSRALDFPEFESRVHRCAGPAEQALRLARLASRYEAEGAGRAAATLALGIADPDVTAFLRGDAERARLVLYNPEGERRRHTALYHLLVAIGGLAEHAGWSAVEQLARCPDFLAFLSRRGTGEFSAARFLAQLDELRRKHLPVDLAEARAHATGEAAEGLAAIEELRDELARHPFPRNYAEGLGNLFRQRVLDPAQPLDAQLLDAAPAWTAVLRECERAAAHFPRVQPADWRELALRLFAEGRRSEDKPAGALEVQGWLELLFDDTSHLVLTGLNDGLVPEAIADDPFLPDSLRTRLGLRTNATRFARDAYQLQALLRSRAAAGRVDVFFGRTTAAGDPLKPSRLLLLCPDEQLPGRVDFLFRAPPPAESNLAWTRSWRLRPPHVPAPKTVAVTALRRWLACPFRFYLKYALRMESIDPAKTEMDAFDFGTLCHAALEAMSREPALRDCIEASVLREFLLHELQRLATAKFGRELSLPLLIQAESAKQRLAKFADVQALLREEGWVTQAVEQPFSVELGGVTVKGKIDRIDRNEHTGAVRVVDYKTSDSGTAPRLAHIRAVRPEEALPEWMLVEGEGRRRAWADLQLPLYRHALAPTWGDAISCGYVILPKAVSETSLSLWDDYTPELHASAMRCAEQVCAAIAAGQFWPPNEAIRAERDEFAPLIHHGVAESFDWSGSLPPAAK
jgi:ATP-dependent helicase/nuclease subunit B